MSPATPFDRHPLDRHPLDDLAVYALDALDGRERLALERHLAGCPSCRVELDTLRATAAHLVRPTVPPAHIWRSITASLAPAADQIPDHPRPSAAPSTRAADGFPPSPPPDMRGPADDRRWDHRGRPGIDGTERADGFAPGQAHDVPRPVDGSGRRWADELAPGPAHDGRRPAGVPGPAHLGRWPGWLPGAAPGAGDGAHGAGRGDVDDERTVRPSLRAVGGADDLAGARGGGAEAGAPVAPGPERRRHPSLDRGRGRATGTGRVPGRRRFAGVLAAAAAVAVVAGGLGFLSGRAGERVPSTDVAALAESALADAGNVQVPLTDGDGAEVARVVVDDSSGYVVLDGLAPLPAGRAYQLWHLDGTTPVSLGVLGDGTVAALAVPLPREAARLAVTAEPAGGGAVPTGPVVARGLLPAAA